MSGQSVKLYRPFESRVSREISLHGAFDRLQQNLWGEPNQKNHIEVKVYHSTSDSPSNKIFFLASQDVVHLEVHHNQDLYTRLSALVQKTITNRSFTRYSLARFIVDNGFEIHY